MGPLTSIRKWLVLLQSARAASAGSGSRRAATFGAGLVGGLVGLTVVSAATSMRRRAAAEPMNETARAH